MEKIVYAPVLKERLNNLVDILFKKGYFVYKENATQYVLAIRDFIYTIPNQRHYTTKNPKHGQYYCKYQPNKHTTWYITFDTDGETYLIKNIMNNHTKEYPTFIQGAK